jgi:hypothetical protein
MSMQRGLGRHDTKLMRARNAPNSVVPSSRDLVVRITSLGHGLLDKLNRPVLPINGKHDHLSPIGELYLALESGPPTGRVARVYPEDGTHRGTPRGRVGTGDMGVATGTT